MSEGGRPGIGPNPERTPNQEPRTPFPFSVKRYHASDLRSPTVYLPGPVYGRQRLGIRAAPREAQQGDAEPGEQVPRDPGQGGRRGKAARPASRGAAREPRVRRCADRGGDAGPPARTGPDGARQWTIG